MSKLLFALCLSLVVALLLSWAAPISQAFEPRDYSVQGGHLEPWTMDRGSEFLEWCHDVHIRYTEEPERCNGETGSVEFHRAIASEYQALIDELKERERCE